MSDAPGEERASSVHVARDAPLQARTWPCCPREAEEHLGRPIAEHSFIEITCEEQPLFQYVQQHVSKLLTEEGGPSFSSARASRQRARTDSLEEVGIIIYGKGVGKSRGQKRKRSKESRWPKHPVVGLGWHRFEFRPIALKDEEGEGSDGPAKESGADDGPAVVSAGDAGSLPASTQGEPARESAAEQSEKVEAATIWALLQTLGAPVKGDMGVCQMYSSLTLFTFGKAKTSVLWDFCQEAAKVATKVQSNVVSIWRYDMKHHFWQQLARRQPRLLKSVIMDKNQKAKLVEDLSWFLEDDTSDFYAKHGIPYHRSYLFYGPPGAGKTSCIFALAGHFKRNICFIQFDKGTTDDTFRLAVSDAPAESIVVMEDVDALFTVHRDTADWSSLSFSGFLNALDGLGAPEDVIFILTTNHPERLDPAVRRPGRIDLHVAFSTPSREMAAEYFGVFYPGATAEAQAFAAATGERLRRGDLSMAQLQHFFLECHRRGKDAKAAAEHVKDYHFECLGSNSGANRMIS